MTVTIKSWYNASEWTGDIPINMLPFFVYLVSIGEGPYIQEEFPDSFIINYVDFCQCMGISEESDDLRDWCMMQYTHFYECNH